MQIYKITNLVNGKIYIGQTINSLQSRLKAHCYKNSDCPKLSNAIQKYGKENFIIEQIAVTFTGTMEELNALETMWILLLEARGPNGYNISPGGSGTGKKTPEQRKQMSIARLGKKMPPFSEEHKRKLSLAAKNRLIHPFQINPYRPVFTQEDKDKVSERFKGKIQNKEHVDKRVNTKKERKLADPNYAKHSLEAIESRKNKIAKDKQELLENNPEEYILGRFLDFLRKGWHKEVEKMKDPSFGKWDNEYKENYKTKLKDMKENDPEAYKAFQDAKNAKRDPITMNKTQTITKRKKRLNKFLELNLISEEIFNEELIYLNFCLSNLETFDVDLDKKRFPYNIILPR